MKRHRVNLGITILSGLVLPILLSGCLGGSSRPATFYMLDAGAAVGASQSSEPSRHDLSVLIGPITMAEYLKRDQIVRRSGESGIIVDEFNRWAEPLVNAFYRVLVQDLSARLKTPRIYAYSSDTNAPVRYQVVLDVTRFDGDSQGNTLLIAFWTIYGGEGRQVLANKKTVLHTQAAGPDLTALVAAENELLITLSRQIAEALQQLK